MMGRWHDRVNGKGLDSTLWDEVLALRNDGTLRQEVLFDLGFTPIGNPLAIRLPLLDPLSSANVSARRAARCGAG